MDKATLRQRFLAQRKALSAEEVRQRSQRIARHFFEFLDEKDLARTPFTIHTFLPIKRQNEIDTWLIIKQIWANYANVRLAVPVTDGPTHTLHHYPLFPQTPLIENRWGIPEPATDCQSLVESVDCDIVLIPLLIFDRYGQRVGYGGGFYDRFLAECRPDCLKMGLSLFEPISQIDDVALTDVQLTYCITPECLYSFN